MNRYDGAAAVRGAREALAEAIAKDGVPVSQLAGHVNDVAYEEGRADAHERMTKAAKRGGSAAATRVAMRLLAQGPDDQWSGRKNDVARARFDGMRRAVDEAQYDPELLWDGEE